MSLPTGGSGLKRRRQEKRDLIAAATGALIRVRDERVTGRKAGGRLRQTGQQKMPICRAFTGATGLEPATSGVDAEAERADSGVVERTARREIADPHAYVIEQHSVLVPHRAEYRARHRPDEPRERLQPRRLLR